jgi:enoyl-[acyl-carrier protein] reductase II
MGQSAGGVHDVPPAGEIVRRIVAEAEAALDRATALRARAAEPA